MLCASDAGIVSKSAEGLAKKMIVNMNAFEAAGLTVSEKREETMLLQTPDQTPRAPPFIIEAAEQIHKQTDGEVPVPQWRYPQTC